MRPCTKIVLPFVAVLALVAWPVYAFQHEGRGNPVDAAKLMADNKMTLAKAIEAAEAHSKGAAVGAHAMVTGTELTIQVVCVAGDKVVKCAVDKAGKVTDLQDAKELRRKGEGKGEAKGGAADDGTKEAAPKAPANPEQPKKP